MVLSPRGKDQKSTHRTFKSVEPHSHPRVTCKRPDQLNLTEMVSSMTLTENGLVRNKLINIEAVKSFNLKKGRSVKFYGNLKTCKDK